MVSILSETTFQGVSIHGILSDVQFLLSRVPPDSILGPLVFTIYILPLWAIVQRDGVKYNFYVDDTQLYISLDPVNELNVSLSLTTLTWY